MFSAPTDAAPADWTVSPGLTDYRAAEAFMAARAAAIAGGRASELVWLLEHPPLYTAGTSAAPRDLIAPDRLPVFKTGRGGQFTYHGPGQRIAYLMLDLRARGGDVHAYVAALEAWIIRVLSELGVGAFTRKSRVGVWTLAGGKEAKIASIGIRVSRWVSMHGISLNVAPDLSHYSGIVPCGISDLGVTSLAELGINAEMGVVDLRLRAAFEREFGATLDAPPSVLAAHSAA